VIAGSSLKRAEIRTVFGNTLVIFAPCAMAFSLNFIRKCLKASYTVEKAMIVA
jgi:hypothetical protein